MKSALMRPCAAVCGGFVCVQYWGVLCCNICGNGVARRLKRWIDPAAPPSAAEDSSLAAPPIAGPGTVQTAAMTPGSRRRVTGRYVDTFASPGSTPALEPPPTRSLAASGGTTGPSPVRMFVPVPPVVAAAPPSDDAGGAVSEATAAAGGPEATVAAAAASALATAGAGAAAVAPEERGGASAAPVHEAHLDVAPPSPSALAMPAGPGGAEEGALDMTGVFTGMPGVGLVDVSWGGEPDGGARAPEPAAHDASWILPDVVSSVAAAAPAEHAAVAAAAAGGAIAVDARGHDAGLHGVEGASAVVPTAESGAPLVDSVPAFVGIDAAVGVGSPPETAQFVSAVDDSFYAPAGPTSGRRALPILSPPLHMSGAASSRRAWVPAAATAAAAAGTPGLTTARADWTEASFVGDGGGGGGGGASDEQRQPGSRVRRDAPSESAEQRLHERDVARWVRTSEAVALQSAKMRRLVGHLLDGVSLPRADGSPDPADGGAPLGPRAAEALALARQLTYDVPMAAPRGPVGDRGDDAPLAFVAQTVLREVSGLCSVVTSYATYARVRCVLLLLLHVRAEGVTAGCVCVHGRRSTVAGELEDKRRHMRYMEDLLAEEVAARARLEVEVRGRVRAWVARPPPPRP
jgi:hypothetical protein